MKDLPNWNPLLINRCDPSAKGSPTAGKATLFSGENAPFSPENAPFSPENAPFSPENAPFSPDNAPFSCANAAFAQANRRCFFYFFDIHSMKVFVYNAPQSNMSDFRRRVRLPLSPLVPSPIRP
jgi:hypothetical protein